MKKYIFLLVLFFTFSLPVFAYTKEDYQKLVQRMYNGEYEVFSDSTTFPETEITATDYGSIK